MKRVLISGGMGGIGRATAARFAANGYQVVILYRKTPLQTVQRFLASIDGGGHEALACDLGDEVAVKQIIATVQKNGPIDVCIHAAVSPIVRKRASDIDPGKFRAQFDVTVFGALNLFQAVIPTFKAAKKGRIIAISTAILEPGAQELGMSGYVSAKYALRGLLRELAGELGPSGIGVSAVAPSFVATQLHSDLPLPILEFVRDRRPAELRSTPEEVADAVYSLCDVDVSIVNGRSYLMDGTFSVL